MAAVVSAGQLEACHAFTAREGDGSARARTMARGLGIVATLIVFCHAGALSYPFLFDGIPLSEDLQRLSLAAPGAWLRLRPRMVGYLSFDAQYSVHGLWYPGFHAANIAIHASAACLLFLIVHGVTSAGLGPSRSAAAGLFTALLWGLHPLQTHSVTYLYQRFESLMGLFFLAGLYCLWRGGAGSTPRRWLAASYGCVLMSIATKEVGITALPVFVLFDRVFLASTWQEVFQRRSGYYLTVLATVCGGVGYVLVNRDHYLAGGLLCAQRVSPWQYLRTQPEVIGHYLSQAIWPSYLSIDPAWPVQDDPWRLAVAWGAVGIAAMVTVWLWRCHREVGFLVLAFVIVLAPTSSVAPVIDLAFEHRVALSLACLAAGIGVGVVTVVADVRLASVLLASAVVALALATLARIPVHASPLALWSDTVQKGPHNTRAWANLGTACEEADDIESAVRCYAEIVAIYRGAAGYERHPLADIVRRVPRTIEYVWYAYTRLACLALDAGDGALAQGFYDEITRLPALPVGGLDRPEIKSLRERLAARKAG